MPATICWSISRVLTPYTVAEPQFAQVMGANKVLDALAGVLSSQL